ncbi:MAG: tyrosine-type recombinase/integrase, partial [Hyphomicrobiales bacterium]|nr:tyrosine-type recombinase/integrase [Hyphomicrobiales bacterium]
MKFTLHRIESLTCPAGKKDRLIFADAPRGFAVRVGAAAKADSLENKTFIVQYNRNGAKRRVALGGCASVALVDAIKAAKAVLGEAAQGRDPARERREKALQTKRQEAHDAYTLAALVDDWEKLHHARRRPSYARRAPSAVRRVFRDYLDLPAGDMTRALAVRALDALVRRGSPVMAARAGSYAGSCFEWAIARGVLTMNPFVRLPKAPEAKRARVLSDAEIAAVWRAAETMPTYGAIVRLLLLTGARRDEVAGLPWGELNADLSLWSLPETRAKNHVACVWPLARQARAILAAELRRNDNPHVFPGDRGGSFRSFVRRKAALDQASGVIDWTLHDLRRTCATGLQKLGVR